MGDEEGASVADISYLQVRAVVHGQGPARERVGGSGSSGGRRRHAREVRSELTIR